MDYDNHVEFDEANESAKQAKQLGWSGIVVIQKYSPSLKPQSKKIAGVNVITGVEITGNPDQMRKILHNIRRRFDLIVVRGGDLALNRFAVESPLVDMLIQPWGDPITGLRNDPGINYIMAKLARKNNVFIDFAFSDLLKSHKKTRIKLFSSMIKVAKIVKKYKTPFTLSSGALSQWDLRSHSDIKAFGHLLGFDDTQIKKATSDVIIKENMKRKSSDWIQPGVEIVSK